MVFSLILEIQSNNYVSVTNSETKETIKLTLRFVQKVTNNSLSSMLCQYKSYELILEAEKYWNRLKKFNPQIEPEIIIKEIELEEQRVKHSIHNYVVQQEREKTAAKQKHWDKVAAYNRSQKQWLNDGYKVILQCEKSCQKASIALQYADYCLDNDYRYNSKKLNIKDNTNIQITEQDKFQEDQYNILSVILKEQEHKIITLQKENQVLQKIINDLMATKYLNT